jgi:hypothetical protein
MLAKLRGAWRSWRESRRQYQIDRAVFKAGGGDPRKKHEPDLPDGPVNPPTPGV